MATRNLTLDFVRLRSRSLPARGAGAGHGGGAYDMRPLVDGAADVEAGAASAVGGAGGIGGLPPKYVDVVTDVQAEVKAIQDKMKRLDAVHRQRLTVTFDDTQEAALERDIDVLTREITRHFQSAGGLLKQVAPGGDRSADANVRRNIQRSSAAQLQELSGDFRKAQKAYLARLRAKKEGTGPDLLGAAGGAGGDGADAKDIDLGFSESQRAETDMLEASSRERDSEIRKIAKNIEELAVIFKELATLIIDQGTVLDRIDYNMDMVVERTREGLKELEKAEEYQKSARPKKCIAFLLIMITIMVIVLILKKQNN